MHPRLRLVSLIAVLAAVYFEAGHLGLKLASVHACATAVWAPTGIALAALVVLGRRVWPGVFIGAFLVNLTTAGNVWSSLLIAIGNTLEGLLGMALVARFAGGRDFPLSARHITRFVILGGLASTIVSATFGVGTITLLGFADASRFWSIWLHWWLGDASGAVLVAPMLVAWYADPRPGWNRRQTYEAVLLLGAIVGFALLVFSPMTSVPSIGYPTAFLVMPLLLWPAVRFGPRETATAMFILALLALRGTLMGAGPFASAMPMATLLSLQTFMGVAAVTSMVIAASTSEHRRATRELRRSRRELQAANAQLVATSLSDPLTGVANRRGFESRLSEEVTRSGRNSAPLSMLIIDVDRFRRHNQVLGHGGADSVLKAVASLIRGQIRKCDYLARFGGDEFVVILPDTRADGACTIAERCRRAVATHTWESRAVTVSIGVGAIRNRSAGAAELLADADQALFDAKGAGRNRIAKATPGKTRKSRVQTAAAG